MESFLRDIRDGFRTLTKTPGFTAVAVLTLALGIGANTAIFSVINAVLLHPLPIRDAQRIVMLHDQFPSWDMPRTSVSALQVVEVARRTDLFESSGAMQALDLNLTDRDPSSRLQAMEVTAGFMTVLGVEPYLGRNFTDNDNEFESMLVTHSGVGGAGRHVVILSKKIWKGIFGSDATIVGKTVQLEAHSYEVIGVLPKEIEVMYPQTDIWVPAAFSPEELTEKHRWYVGYTMLARLRKEVTLEQAQAALTTVANGFSGEDFKFGIELRPLIEEEVGDLRTPLSFLVSAVGLVLLIACSNIANLSLARNSLRKREIAIRTVLGAGYRRIVSRLITESTLLALAGGLSGLLLAQGCLFALVRLAPTNLPHVSMIRLDMRVLLFTLSLSVLAAALFGVVPAMLSARPELSETLKEGIQGGRGRSLFRSALVITEIALALALLASSGLLLRSFAKLLEVRPGFDPNNVLTMKLSLSQMTGVAPGRVPSVSKSILDRVRTLPGVLHAAISTGSPFAPSGFATTFEVRDQHLAPQDPEPHAAIMYVTPDYFETMKIPLMKGRFYTLAEMQSGNATGKGTVRLIDEALAKRFWPDRDPVGTEIGNGDQWSRIVGVVGTIHDSDLAAESSGTIYVPGYGGSTLLIRTGSDPMRLSSAAREEVGVASSSLPVYDVSTMSDLVAASLQQRKFTTSLLAVFATLAVLLAFVGLYGVITQIVTQRTYEIGVRMALGANPNQVRRMVVFQGMRLNFVGLILGVICSLALTRLMKSMLFGVKPWDPATIIVVVMLLSLVTLLAAYLPARRASRVDPIVALRYE